MSLFRATVLSSALVCGLMLTPQLSLNASEQIHIKAEAPAALDADHSIFAGVLSKVVHTDGVDYAALHADPSQLHAYLAQLAMAQVPEGREAQLAFWINAYNAATLALVLKKFQIPRGIARA